LILVTPRAAGSPPTIKLLIEALLVRLLPMRCSGKLPLSHFLFYVELIVPRKLKFALVSQYPEIQRFCPTATISLLQGSSARPQ
jgi:hypothetical protein